MIVSTLYKKVRAIKLILSTLFYEWCHSNIICREKCSACIDIQKKSTAQTLNHVTLATKKQVQRERTAIKGESTPTRRLLREVVTGIRIRRAYKIIHTSFRRTITGSRKKIGCVTYLGH
jgi:hypothetical protein